MTSSARTPEASTIYLVCCADNRFPMPLAVTIRSALDTLGADRRIHLFIVDGGISRANRRKLLASWPKERLSVEWIQAGNAPLAELSTSGHVTLATYFRVLIPELVPRDLNRCLYIDSDLLVRADLGRLWDLPLEGWHCLAAQDIGSPFINSAECLANFARCQPYLGAVTPIPNYRDLGIESRAMNFNAGILSINLELWRRDRISQRLIQCLRVNARHMLWWDQYALNIVLAGKWRPLDIRWNQGTHTFKYPTWQESPLDESTFVQLRNDPYIVHFTTQSKPWHALSRHPYREEFFQCLDRTAWKGWRPSALRVVGARLRRMLGRVYRGVRQRYFPWFRPMSMSRAASGEA